MPIWYLLVGVLLRFPQFQNILENSETNLKNLNNSRLNRFRRVYFFALTEAAQQMSLPNCGLRRRILHGRFSFLAIEVLWPRAVGFAFWAARMSEDQRTPAEDFISSSKSTGVAAQVSLHMQP